VGQEQCRDWRF